MGVLSWVRWKLLAVDDDNAVNFYFGEILLQLLSLAGGLPMESNSSWQISLLDSSSASGFSYPAPAL